MVHALTTPLIMPAWLLSTIVFSAFIAGAGTMGMGLLWYAQQAYRRAMDEELQSRGHA